MHRSVHKFYIALILEKLSLRETANVVVTLFGVSRANVHTLAAKTISYGYSLVRLCQSFVELAGVEDALKQFIANLDHKLIMSQARYNVEFNKMLSLVVSLLELYRTFILTKNFSLLQLLASCCNATEQNKYRKY